MLLRLRGGTQAHRLQVRDKDVQRVRPTAGRPTEEGDHDAVEAGPVRCAAVHGGRLPSRGDTMHIPTDLPTNALPSFRTLSSVGLCRRDLGVHEQGLS